MSLFKKYLLKSSGTQFLIGWNIFLVILLQWVASFKRSRTTYFMATSANSALTLFERYDKSPESSLTPTALYPKSFNVNATAQKFGSPLLKIGNFYWLLQIGMLIAERKYEWTNRYFQKYCELLHSFWLKIFGAYIHLWIVLLFNYIDYFSCKLRGWPCINSNDLKQGMPPARSDLRCQYPE